MNKEAIDSISRLLTVALDLLFLKNPQRSSLGVLLGVVLQTLAQIFAPSIQQMQWINIATIQWYQYWIIGLGIMYLPMLIRYLFTPVGLGEEVELALRIIKQAEKAGLPKKDVNKLYLHLSETVLKNTVLNEDIRTAIASSDKEQKVTK